MDIKPGKETSEYKLTAIANIISAFLALAVAYGILTTEESALWASLLMALVAVAAPLAMAWMTREYTRGRTALKLMAANEQKPEATE